MKTLLLTAVCATILIGAGNIAAASQSVDPAPQSQNKPMMRHTGGHGAWPNSWVKGDERAATDALNDLEAHGYATFSNFHKKGSDFEATVMQDGKALQVLVDPAKGTVTQES
jgi:opacity protein-like surface antigen